LVTDSFPALALVIDPFDSEIIKNKPEDLKKGFMHGKRGYNMLIEGTFIGIICIIAFLLGRNLFDLDYNDPIIGRTMAFMTIGISQLAHAFNVRSEESIFKSGILGNAKLILATLMCTFLQVIVVFVEKLNTLFRTDQLNFTQWLIVLSLSILPTVVSEIEKKISKDKNQVLKAKNLNKIFLKSKN
jgi:Ca2+-transporting ATPase